MKKDIIYADKKVIDRLKMFQEQKNYSPYDLASEAGMERSTIYRWYCGTQFASFQSLAKVCTVLGIELIDLFCVNNYVIETDEMKELNDLYLTLSDEDKKAILKILRALNKNKEGDGK